MCPTHRWTFPSKWKHFKGNGLKPNSPLAPHRPAFPLCSLSHLAAGTTVSLQRQEPDTWGTLPSRHQIIPNSPSLAWFKALVLKCCKRLFSDPLTSLLPILKTILDPATRGIHPTYKADHMPCPHSPGMHNGENGGKLNHWGTASFGGEIHQFCAFSLQEGWGGWVRAQCVTHYLDRAEKGLVVTEGSYCEESRQATGHPV